MGVFGGEGSGEDERDATFGEGLEGENVEGKDATAGFGLRTEGLVSRLDDGFVSSGDDGGTL